MSDRSSEDGFNKAADRAASQLGAVRLKAVREEQEADRKASERQIQETMRQRDQSRSEEIQKLALTMLSAPKLDYKSDDPRWPTVSKTPYERAADFIDQRNADERTAMRSEMNLRQSAIAERHYKEAGIEPTASASDAYRDALKADKTDAVLSRSDPQPERNANDRGR